MSSDPEATKQAESELESELIAILKPSLCSLVAKLRKFVVGAKGQLHTLQYVNSVDPIQTPNRFFSVTASVDHAAYRAAIDDYFSDSNNESLLDLKQDWKHYWDSKLARPESTPARVVKSEITEDQLPLSFEEIETAPESQIDQDRTETNFKIWTRSLGSQLAPPDSNMYTTVWVSQAYVDLAGSHRAGAIFLVFRTPSYPWSDKAAARDDEWLKLMGKLSNACREFIVDASHARWRQHYSSKRFQAKHDLVKLSDEESRKVYMQPRVARRISQIAELSREQVPIPIISVLGEVGTGKAIISRFLHQKLGQGMTVKQIAPNTPANVMEQCLIDLLDDAPSQEPVGYIFEDFDQVADADCTKLFKRVVVKLAQPSLHSQSTQIGLSRVACFTARPYLHERLSARKEFDDDFLQRLQAVTVRVPSLKEVPEHIRISSVAVLDALNRGAAFIGQSAVHLDDSAIAALQKTGLAGNQRELQYRLVKGFLAAKPRPLGSRTITSQDVL
jgi:hypothetical protein